MAKAAAKKAAMKPSVKGPAMKLTEFTPAKIADAITATGAKKSGKLLLVPLEALHVAPGFNLRITDSAEYIKGIEDLAQSMEMEGFYSSKPISGFAAEIDGTAGIVIIDGHRRYAAVMKAVENGMDCDSIPVVLKDPGVTDLDLAVALEKENRSVPLTMLERAVLAHRMIRAGETEEDVAARLQVTTRHVNDLKVLIAAPRAVRDLIKEGKLAATEAVRSLRADPSGEKILAAAEKAEKRAAEKETAAKGVKDSKLTKQTIEGEKEAKVKMQTLKLNFSATEGATFLMEDAEPFLGLLGEDWFKNTRKKTERIALETVEIEVRIRRPKSEEEVDAEQEAAQTKVAAVETKKAAAPAKNGRAVAPKPPGRTPKATDEADDDLGGDDDLGDDAPNLRELGIAEPAGAEL